MAQRKVFCKLTAENGSDYYYLMTTLFDDGEAGFNLAITDGKSVYTTKVGEDDLAKMSRKIKMAQTVFVNESVKALTRENVGNLNFLYQFKEGADEMQFIWKKHMAADNIKFQLGNVKLTKKTDSRPYFFKMFDHALSGTDVLKEKISSLEADNERLVSERASALKRLEKCVEAKEQLEKDLYSKFATVVNDKKAKIRSLKDACDGIGSATQSSTQNGTQQPSTSGVSRKRAAESEDEDDKDGAFGSDYNTDDEEPSPKSSTPVKKGKASKAAIKKEVKDEPPDDDDDLMLGGGDMDTSPAPPTRRRRRGEASNMKTPSRPVIPKVTSASKLKPSPSTSRRTPLRKSASRTSDRSSDNLESEDLIGQL